MAQTRNGIAPAAELAIRKTNRPQAFGLFDPMREHDACGVGFIVNLRNRKSQAIVQNGLKLLQNLEHRGAVGADPLMGDGAGIMVQIPHRFFVQEGRRLGFPVPAPGQYAVGFIFPNNAALKSPWVCGVSGAVFTTKSASEASFGNSSARPT